MSTNQIKALREKKGWTQNDLADETGLSVRTIQRIESGTTMPKGHTLKVLIEVFGDALNTDSKLPDELKIMNMSCLTFMVLPFGNLIFPTILWFKHKTNEQVNLIGRRILNFQITWYLFTSLATFGLIFIQQHVKFNVIFWGLIIMTLVNIVSIIRAAKLLSRNDKNIYRNSIKIL